MKNGELVALNFQLEVLRLVWINLGLGSCKFLPMSPVCLAQDDELCPGDQAGEIRFLGVIANGRFRRSK